MSSRCASTTILLLIWAGAAAAQPQSSDTSALPAFVARPIPIYKVGLGSFSRKISSSNAEAQAFFDQGFQLMYSFAKYEAVRSFREAWKRDPAGAMCYWGEAWAWGSNLNQVMTTIDAPFGYAAAQKALLLKHKATDRERALIEALAQRYVEHFNPATRGEQDKALVYAASMDGQGVRARITRSSPAAIRSFTC